MAPSTRGSNMAPTGWAKTTILMIRMPSRTTPRRVSIDWILDFPLTGDWVVMLDSDMARSIKPGTVKYNRNFLSQLLAKFANSE